MTLNQTITSGVYLIRNTINGKLYVGSSVQMKKRWKRHLYDLKVGKHPNPKLQNAFLKYGLSAFDFEILCYETNSELLTGLEDVYIDSLKPAYNCKKACDTGRVDGTLSFRERISKATKGIKHSEEHKKKIGESHRGLKRSPEACANIGAASRGRRHSEETKAKIGRASLGHVLSEEAKQKIGASHKGKLVSEETRAKLRAAWFQKRLVRNQTHEEGSRIISTGTSP